MIYTQRTCKHFKTCCEKIDRKILDNNFKGRKYYILHIKIKNITHL